MRASFLAVLLVSLLGAAATDNPAIKQEPIFVSGKDGYHTYRIPAMVVTTNGTILAFCEGRKEAGGDAGRIDLLVKRSTDGGKSWSSQQTVWSDERNTCGNPAPVVDRDTGTIWVLMTWNLAEDKESAIEYGKSKDTRRAFVTRSNDDGRSWAKPSEITPSVKKSDWGWYATGPVNGIQLSRGQYKGRLVVPANHSQMNPQGKPVTRSHNIYSDDHGKTWHLGGLQDERTNESTIAELSDGSLLQNMRTYKGKNLRAIARSKDAGKTWTPVTHDPVLIEPVCQGSILRVTWPEEGRSRIAFSNPASLQREKMTVRMSYDEGVSWPASLILHEGPSAYSCLTVLPDNDVGCLYERGEKKPYETITFARFPISSLEDKKAAPETTAQAQ